MKALVIGGGLAGLSSAVYLSDYGFECTVLEQSPKLGGRAYSFYHPKFPVAIDNGQHLMLGCYRFTLDFLNLIKAMDKISVASRLQMHLFRTDGALVSLEAPNLPFPFDLATAFLNYKALPLLQRIKMLPFLAKLKSINPNELSSLSVLQWLKLNNQTGEMISAIWEIIGIGALNTSLENASAELFATILKEIFTKDSFSSTVILPKWGLSEMYVTQSKEFIYERGGEVLTSTPVLELNIKNDKVVGVVTGANTYNSFDVVVSTVPLNALPKIKNSEFIFNDHRIPQLQYSSILTLHLKTNKNIMKHEFCGFINSPLHWVFNKKTHLTTVISNADMYIDWGKEELFNLIMEELHKNMGISKSEITDYIVIKEKKATFLPNEANLKLRPNQRTAITNVFLAGDYTNTGLPATIEGAVRSGKTVAELIKNNFYN